MIENLRSKRGKKAQITIFVILAIIVVALIAFLFVPQIRRAIIPAAPEEMIPKACVEQAARNSLNTTMIHGGKVNPELYFMYNNEPVDYLCYTNTWYQMCTMQNPFLLQSVESETAKDSQPEIEKCINEMITRLQNRGYNVKISGAKRAEINLIPGKIVVSFNMTMTIEKGEEKQSFSSSRFQTEFKSNAYEIIMVASSIQNWEARLGEAIPETYMGYYPNLKVEKKKQDDGTKIYIITDRDTLEVLQFATRSLSWPPGYAFPPSSKTI
jgi:hypothetical protein